MKNPKKYQLFLVAVRVINNQIYVVNIEGDILVYPNPVKSQQPSLLTSYPGPRSKIVKLLSFENKYTILLDSGGRVLSVDLGDKTVKVCCKEIEMNNIANGFVQG